MSLPRCGLYRTRVLVDGIPAGRLVYFHDHGSPGPGVYLPERWLGNRARFAARGTTLTEPDLASEHLEPVAAEGLYRVGSTFTCCAERCREYRPDMLVQLGYDAQAAPILFVPELAEGAVALPTRGTRIDRERIAHLVRLEVPIRDEVHDDGAPELLH